MYSIQENDHQTKPQIYKKKKKRFHGKTNLNITKFLVHKVGGAKWPDSRRNSAAYRPLMTTLFSLQPWVSQCARNPPHHQRIMGVPRHPWLETEYKCQPHPHIYLKSPGLRSLISRFFWVFFFQNLEICMW